MVGLERSGFRTHEDIMPGGLDDVFDGVSGPADRRHRRYPARMSIVLQSGATTMSVTTVDVGRYGVGLQTSEALPVHGLVDLLVPMPDGEESLDLTGMVSYQVRPEADEGGLRAGIHLHFFGSYQPERWQRLVAALEERERITQRNGAASGRLSRSLMWEIG